MIKKILIAGFGGQGVVVAGNIIARAGIAEGRFVAGMVSYGAEMRGGTANSTVIISDKEIASPVVEKPDIGIILNQPSLDKFEDMIMDNGTVILNSSLIKRDVERNDLEIVKVDSTRIAEELGNVKVANIVTLGALIKKTGILKMGSMEKAVDELFSEKKPEFIDINKRALMKGAELCT